MANKNFILGPAEEIPDIIRDILVHAFGDEALAMVKTSGGKLCLRLTTPWPKAKKPKRPPFEVSDELIQSLLDAANDMEGLDTELSKYKGPQLVEIGRRLGVMLSKSSRVVSLRAQLANSLRSGAIWKGIAGQTESEAPSSQAPSRAKLPTSNDHV
jgi:hypothetical protein